VITVYLITCLRTGKQYVGKTRRPLTKRWAAHCADGKGGSTMPIAKAIRRYGPEAFSVVAIGFARTEEKASSFEALQIFRLQTLAPLGFNITTGGKSGYSICNVGRKSMRPKNPRRGKRNIARAIGYDVRLVKSR
jgi:group I intron endonuclease